LLILLGFDRAPIKGNGSGKIQGLMANENYNHISSAIVYYKAE